LFKNVGRSAGASLPHTHTQLMATPFVLPTVHNEMQRARRYYENQGGCLACDYLARELEREERLVEVTERFVVLCPYAPRFPMEVSILPRAHRVRFEETPDEELAVLARLARRTVGRLEKAVPERALPLAYNMIFYSAPFIPLQRDDYHWRILIMPSLAKAAGFEWGSGLHINPFSPEKTARQLRALG
jgi:UDPglucose--hexose-1-phosphate uridylyltransferase